MFHISTERILDMAAEPWYVGWSVCQASVFQELSKLVSLPQFLSNKHAAGNMWIFIGTPGYGAHSHLDHDLDLPTWQAQISGTKTWFLKPPPECALDVNTFHSFSPNIKRFKTPSSKKCIKIEKRVSNKNICGNIFPL